LVLATQELGGITGRDTAHDYPWSMAGDRELLREIDVSRAHELLSGEDAPVLVDIREPSELETGWIDGALRVPMSELSNQLEEHRDRTLVIYCAHGNRSLRVADALAEAGYGDPVSLAGGIVAWERAGLPIETPAGLDDEQRRRYSRHLLIPEIGQAGQLRLLEASVLLIGAGGLGSPAALYLAAAGVGRLGIVDDDVVDETNLQRQVLHSTAALDEPKVDSAVRRIRELNPDVEVVPYRERLGSENVDRILEEGWEVIVDGADNFPTRYLINDASVWHGIPVVHGSIFRFEGQATVFKSGDGPCYRCLFPQPPPPELAPSCAEGGVLGVLPGVIGSIQGAEALKLVLGIGEPLVGRLLLYDALAGSFDEVAVRRDPTCPVCGDSPTITGYVDYVEFCGRPG
jgi:molybdopterin/thiamine biosynthesis adenylyltransferase/rhodanese-related sulfurtransferase